MWVAVYFALALSASGQFSPDHGPLHNPGEPFTSQAACEEFLDTKKAEADKVTVDALVDGRVQTFCVKVTLPGV